MTTTTSSPKGPPNDDSNIIETGSSNSHEDEEDPFMFRSRKSYPQRNNRPKLNYRDLERGVYDTYEMRQSMWALGGPTLLEKNNRSAKESNNTRYSDVEDDEDEMLVDQNDKSNDDTDQMHRRLWCICKKPWDHSRLMLRCDSCANWYHGDCISITKEQARVLEMNGDQFVCPPCQGTSQQSGMKPGRSSDESMMIKRKRLDAVSPLDRKVGERNGNVPMSKNLTYSEPSKRPRSGIFFQRDPLVEPQIHCIVHGCSNWAKSGWVYCSPACIRRHINDTLQTIQRSKGLNNENPPSREDVLLYENKTKKVLDRKLVPKVEDLCAWINQHPSYEIVKPALRQSILLTANESKSSSLPAGLVRPPSVINTLIPKTPTTPNSTKPKLSWAPTVSNTKPLPIKKALVPIGRQTSTTTSSANLQNTADIRSKVPTALYDKLIIRLEKSDEKNVSNDDIRVIVDKIEEEMYRVYGKVDNAYKNKFRSLLANISNMNNNFFYKQILSKEITPKQIVAMKPEDMLPPEEKEKRKDEFEKEVQMIIKAEEQTAEEMARRARMKVTRQGLVDNDAILPLFKQKEAEEKGNERKETKSVTKSETKSKGVKKSDNTTTSKSIIKTKKPIIPVTDQKPTLKSKPVIETSTSNKDTTSSHGQHAFDINCSICANPMIAKPASPKPSPSIPIETIPSIIEPLPIKPLDEPPKFRPPSPIREESTEVSNPTFPSVDLDNDYIEPESPTGIDALLYDDDDDLNNISSHSRPSISLQQHPDSPGDTNDYLPVVQQSVRDDYNPLNASKPKTDPTLLYQPTPIARSPSVTLQWRGFINPPDAKLPCQSVRVYGESDYLIGDIPEQLGILGRLRLGDLWDYIRDSIAVRDVIILTVTSSNNNDNNVFSRYVDTMRTSGRAAVINKRTEPSLIRDMYVLAADIKDSPSNVLSSLSLPANIDSKQLFLVVIGSGKRTTKSLNRPNENQSSSNSLTYKPVSLQEPAATRDPRLLRNKDPRLGGSNVTETITSENGSPSITQPTNNNTKSKPAQYATEDLLKIMSDSLERIRHASSTDVSGPIIKSTMEFLKAIGREDLYVRYTDELHAIMSELQTPKGASSTTAVLVGDNLNEENMDVDEEQDEKNKKHLSISEYNDVDYRFLGQDMDHRMPTTTHENDHRKEGTRKSRFSDVLPSHPRDADDRTRKSNLTEDGKDKRKTIIDKDLDFRTNDSKISSPR